MKQKQCGQHLMNRLTIQGLEACAGDKPMWKVFTPTPLTKKWLVEARFL